MDDSVGRLAATLKRRREEAKPPKSQEQVAHDAQLSLRHYQKIEAGAGDPRLSTLLRIAGALDARLSEILEEIELSRRPRGRPRGQ
jgi:transcriptional regulator with XRE-family HTH domain